MNQQIIMNFSVAPSDDDVIVIAREQLENLPDELDSHIEDLEIQIEEFPDDATQSDLELDDPFDMLVYYKSGKNLSPGVEKKEGKDDNTLILYRRPILDAWCETGDNLVQVVRDAIIEEIAGYFEFSEDDIEELTARHYQGML